MANIRFKFTLSIFSKWKIINYTHLGYRGDACYIVDNEYNTYYLPHDYS